MLMMRTIAVEKLALTAEGLGTVYTILQVLCYYVRRTDHFFNVCLEQGPAVFAGQTETTLTSFGIRVPRLTCACGANHAGFD